ncbi:phospholipase A1-Igamma2, chloroplastic-like [Nicotiana tabacum]|uniref:Phospholipase A1-Igamma2, chloroplastic-like n=2 Tax=Nicotiana TaxID=4085 RepID=A0A1S3XRJ0_TOBAC|nr:PREDICTED: phospholipase A1-Igamma2, chloroplastic-like [Nicotiana sylvestris]XP_016442563.1 PREDICTED: phospholipase A1-Igamma2, chloroplastic-like [Nicotiana tabacum]
MASLTNSILTFQTSTPHQHEGTCFRPDSLLYSSFFPSQKFPNIVKLSTRTPSLSSKTGRSLTSIINELEKERDNNMVDELEEGESTSTTTIKIQEPELADYWLEILGKDDWVGILDPLDPLLRNELIRYGEMAQACYDAFDFDPYSKYCGSCKFPRHKFFDGLDMANYGYDITRYLYATSNINLPNFFKQSRWPKVWSKNANWIGYVAVSNDETSKRLGRRDITISWRGTVTRLEWIADLMDFLRPISSDKIPCPDPNVKVESGFLDLYTDKDENCRYCKFSAREQILTEVKRLVEKYPTEEMSITVTGHSLGSALAILSAYDIVETGVNVRANTRAVPIGVFSFAGPRVGNTRFKQRLEMLGVKVLRVVNVHDIVPKSPGLVFNEHSPSMVMKICEGLPWSYSHVGVELALDHKNSPFLKPTNDLVCAHNLEAHLHLLDGYHGKGRRFVLAKGRDIALVNKACDFLKDHYCVPPNWRQDENKGMIRDKDGRWIQPERPRVLDDHPPDIHHHLKHLGLSSS